MDTQKNSNNTIISQYGTYLNKGMKPNEVLYLHYLKECGLNKTNAYMKLSPDVSRTNAGKNVYKLDKRIRDKFPQEYAEITGESKINEITDIQGKQYIEALVKHHGVKKHAIREVKPHLEEKSLSCAANNMEKRLDARHPQWRTELAKRYDPDKYFKKIDKLANPEDGDVYVPADVQRKACLDMLAFQNFTKKETDSESDRSTRNNKYKNLIDKVLNIKVEDGGVLNITKAEDPA